jgi:hypothetical protein
MSAPTTSATEGPTRIAAEYLEVIAIRAYGD